MKHPTNRLLAAAIATAMPLHGVCAEEPRTQLAQTYGSEAMPGGVEARPSEHEASRSFKKRVPPSEDNFEATLPPPADDAGSATMPAPAPTMPPKNEPESAKPDSAE